MSVEEQRKSKLGGITGKGFMPGQSGNPGGLRPGRTITARLRDLLDAHELGGKKLPNNKQVADLVAEAIVRGAAKGDARILGMLMDRVEGAIKQQVAIEDVTQPDNKATLESKLARLESDAQEEVPGIAD